MARAWRGDGMGSAPVRGRGLPSGPEGWSAHLVLQVPEPQLPLLQAVSRPLELNVLLLALPLQRRLLVLVELLDRSVQGLDVR